MNMHVTSVGALRDPICHYPGSTLPVRGPCSEVTPPYIAFLGGSETFGRFIEAPFAARVAHQLGRSCVNLGSINAGLDAMLNDAGVMRIAAGAGLSVVQLPPVPDLSNLYYRVHRRRNDRFLAPTARLTALYPKVDFTEFHFTRHLVTTLHRTGPGHFVPLRDELRAVWLARMTQLLQALGERALLLWLQYDALPPQAGDPPGPDPLGVTRAMIDRLKPLTRGVVEVPVALASRMPGETGKMVFGPLQAPAAGHMPGPTMHQRIATRLSEAITALR